MIERLFIFISEQDLTKIAYEVSAWSLLYCSLLFIVWWIIVNREKGYVSDVYILLLFLFISRWYAVKMGIRARLLREIDTQAYYDFMGSLQWDTRLAPEALVFIVLAFILTRRFVRSYFFRDPNFKAQNGRRKDDK